MTDQPREPSRRARLVRRVCDPRIATSVNHYALRIPHIWGEHFWHVHENTDEFFLVLDGELDVALRGPDSIDTAHNRPASFHDQSSLTRGGCWVTL